MAYNGFLPENVINIGKIYSIHYFEYMSDFSFEGESHDFWEFICVDKGEVEVTGGDKKFILHKGEIAFHEPMYSEKERSPFMNLMNFIMLQLLERSHRI